MTSDPIESGKRFADDLRRIRESRGLERADLVAALKLDPTILDEFEASGLVGHPRYNRVYLRSFAGGYARVLGIDPKSVSAGLDAVFAGRYRGALAVTHLGDPEPEAIESADQAGAEPGQPKPHAKPRRVHTAEPPPVPSPPPVAVFPVVPVPTPRRITVRRPAAWAGLAVVLVVLVSAGWWWLSLRPVDPAPESRVPESPVPEPVAVDARIVVGDTMRLFVVALDTLNPIRVVVDQKPRAPYWLLPGDSLPFEVTQRIVLERKARLLAISFAGRRLPLPGEDSLGSFILTRTRVQELMDSLRTAG